jgi:hypothetical protein
MTNFKRPYLLMTLMLCLVFFTGYGQEKTGLDTLLNATSKSLPISDKQKKVRKNTILINSQ